MFLLLTGAILFQAQAAPALIPDSVLHVGGAPSIVVFGSPTPGVTAFRLSLPYGPDQEFAAELATQVIRTRAEASGAFIGATVRATRTPTTVALTIAAADEDLDFLGSILRQAMAPAKPDELANALATYRSLREEAAETGLAYLRARATPRCERAPNQQITPAAADAAPAPAIVAASDQPPEVLRAALGSLPTLDLIDRLEARSPPPADTDGSQAPATLREWSGVWWTSREYDTPAMSVLAALLENMDAVVLTSRCASAVLAWSATYPERFSRIGADGAAADRTLDRTLERGLQSLTDSSLDGAIRLVALETRRRASTADGLADLVGQHMDRAGEPSAAVHWLQDLTALELADLQSVVDALQASPPLRAGA